MKPPVMDRGDISAALRDAILPCGDQIHAAFIFGSVAKQEDTPESDIDLLVVSDSLGYADVASLLDPVSATLGRPVHLMLYSREQVAKRVAGGQAFITRVLAGPRIWLIGQDDFMRSAQG